MYDVIVVGARCAGSPIGMLLARKGYRVLVVDRAAFPSDTLSTHLIWPRGVEAPKRWGLLDKLVGSGCPTVALKYLIDFGSVALKGGVTHGNQGRGGLCPRRIVLDHMLVEAAADSGVEVRERFTVDGLIREKDRVAGIKGHLPDGKVIEERARFVIGADGIYSTVAKLVAAPEYNAVPPLVNFYYSYFSGFAIEDCENHIRDYEFITLFPTHNGSGLVHLLLCPGCVRRAAGR